MLYSQVLRRLFPSVLFKRVSRIVVGITLLMSAVAHAGPPKVISKVPFVISKPGQYVLSKNLTYTGNEVAIQINADDVTIDLRDNILAFQSVNSTEVHPVGIFAEQRKNVTIRNGKIRGFFRGIFIRTSDLSAHGGHLVEDICADACLSVGIQVEGRASIVRNNWIRTVDGTIDVVAFREGIFASGPAITVSGNRVTDVRSEMDRVSAGIAIHNAENCVVTGNQVTNTAFSSSTNNRGISVRNSAGAIVAENRISRFETGLDLFNCPNASYRDNTAAQTTTPYDVVSGGFDAGGNTQ